MLDLKRFRTDERISMMLRDLYEGYGYIPYRMSKFEEYELYARNKDFLGDRGILTFTDVNGKLMALKPDVTLSIVKNSKGNSGLQKVHYQENVYRLASDGGYKEIPQSGIECIGDIGECEISEVLLLALKSLELTQKSFRLEISHMGILSALIDQIPLTPSQKDQLYTCIKRKNSDGIREIAAECGVDSPLLSQAIDLNGNWTEVISSLKEICPPSAVRDLSDLENICFILASFGYGNNIGIDLSLLNDMSYYRSLVFRGYIDCIPEGILFGGRYDDLVKKIGGDCGAIGFAVMIDKLKELSRNDRVSYADTLIIYAQDVEAKAVISECEKIRGTGKNVVALPAFDKNYNPSEILYLNKNGISFSSGGDLDA